MQIKPMVRTQEILTCESGKELIIYDLTLDKAFLLNETTCLVWQECDGEKDISQISQTLSQRTKSVFSEEVVWLSLDVLQKQNLLIEPVEAKFKGMSRREVVRKIGIGSMIALPMISSLVAPTSVNAQSNVTTFLRLTLSFSTVNAGQIFSAQVQLVDALLLPIAIGGVEIFLTISPPSSGFPTFSQFTNPSGAVTFNSLIIDNADFYQVTANSPGIPSNSQNITVI
jgi:hypothetical protein